MMISQAQSRRYAEELVYSHCVRSLEVLRPSVLEAYVHLNSMIFRRKGKRSMISSGTEMRQAIEEALSQVRACVSTLLFARCRHEEPALRTAIGGPEKEKQEGNKKKQPWPKK